MPAPPAAPAPPARQWDIFCHVIDNLGDAGVCWRLAADLASRGQRVRLVIDDAAPLAFMAPQGAAGVEVLRWPGPPVPGDVVIEAFGCDPPPAFVAGMATRQPPPVWINLEYLSAQAYVERSHGLPSPQPGGLTKWFYYPGFTSRTGGLLREPGLAAARDAFDRRSWLATHDIRPQPGERVASLFCYANPALPALLDELATAPTLLLPTRAVGPEHDAALAIARPGLRLQRLPWLTQPDYDRLLWACDLNLVRGEDSLVRALWAGAPFVWQIYPQHDGAHVAKLEAMLAHAVLSPAVAALWRAWNGIGSSGQPLRWPGMPPLGPWGAEVRRWRAAQLAQPDLGTQLLGFVADRRPRPC